MEPHNDHHDPNPHELVASDRLIKDVTYLVSIIADDRDDISVSDMLDWLALTGLSLHKEPGAATNAYDRYLRPDTTAN